MSVVLVAEVPACWEAYESIDPEYKDGLVDVPGEEGPKARGELIGVFEAELCMDRRFSNPSLNLMVSDTRPWLRGLSSLPDSFDDGTDIVRTTSDSETRTYNTVLKVPMALRNSSGVGSSTCFPI